MPPCTMPLAEAQPMAAFRTSRLEPDGRGGYFGTTSGAASGSGTVYRVSPSVITLFTFHGDAGGIDPNGVTRGNGGVLFGTTSSGGNAGAGVLFKLTPNGTGYTEHILHNFTGAKGDGRFPGGNVLVIGDTIYGTTTTGGSGPCGTIFKIAASGKKYSVIYSFQCASDGGSPYGDLLWSNGAIYGVASAGGAGNNGIVYSFKP